MAGHEDTVVGQNQQVIADGTEQLLPITRRKNRAADGVLEQHVTNQQQALRHVLEHDVRGRLSGTMAYAWLDRTKADPLAIFQPARGLERARRRESLADGRLGQLLDPE